MPVVRKLSATKISTWRQCRRYYRFQYVDYAEKAFTPVEWEVGNIIHNLVAQLMIEFRSRSQFKGRVGVVQNRRWFEKTYERASGAMRQAVTSEEVRIVRPGDNVEDYISQGERALENFTSEVLPELQGRRILGVEADLGNFRLAKISVLGRLDLVVRENAKEDLNSGANDTTRVTVHDWKTGRRREEDALQARIYYFAAVAKYRAPETAFSFHYLNYEPGEVTDSFEFSEDQLAEMADEIAGTRDAIEAEVDFAPGVGALCHWCPYGPSCPEGQAYIRDHPLAGASESEGFEL